MTTLSLAATTRWSGIPIRRSSSGMIISIIIVLSIVSILIVTPVATTSGRSSYNGSLVTNDVSTIRVAPRLLNHSHCSISDE